VQGKGLGFRFAPRTTATSWALGSPRMQRPPRPRWRSVSCRFPDKGPVRAAANAADAADAITAAEVVLLAVPYDGHDELGGAPLC
jgi:8-hydroxy-5-deazaflavin:NADPH oxidoreductase